MKDHLNQNELQRYHDRRLERGRMSAVILHLARCPECMGVFRNMFPEVIEIERRAGVLPSADCIEDAFHLDYDEHLESYVDGEIDEMDREIVEGHIRSCSYCAGMLRDLQEFRVGLTIRHPEASESKPGFLQRLAAATYRPSALAFSFLIIACAGATTWYFYSNHWIPEVGIMDVAVPTTGEQYASNPDFSIAEKPPEVVAQPPSVAEPEFIPLRLPPFLGSLKLDPPGTLRGDGKMKLINVTSANGVAVRGAPRLSWQAVPGIDSYEISIFDANDTQIGGIEAVSGTSWTFPNLAKGRIYKWQVAANKRDLETDVTRYIGQGSFYLISASEEARIDRARDPIDKGRALAEAGLIREASIEFRRVKASDPSSKIAGAYLRQLPVSE